MEETVVYNVPDDLVDVVGVRSDGLLDVSAHGTADAVEYQRVCDKQEYYDYERN